MQKFQDRIYGAIELPDLAMEVALTCPVVLRLREVRMANIPFLSFPSFANVDRYEHSLGVAHLAWRWARDNNLPEDLGIALTIAALYHDGATPGYGHLFEEFLGRFGFDHERALVNVLIGQPDDIPGRENGQIFLGLQCKLRDILPRLTNPRSPLTPIAIAELTAGRGALGRLIKGDIDFDNIDNVIRACSSMGLGRDQERVHPYDVIDAFVLEDGVVKLRRGYSLPLALWANQRRQLYYNIMNSAHEFRAQTAIKWAIEECAVQDEALANQGAWRLTDPMLTFEHLRKNLFARMLIDRVRIGRPPELLFSAWVNDLSPLQGEESKQTIDMLCRSVAALTNMEVYVNYYIDKRERPLNFEMSERIRLLPMQHKPDNLAVDGPEHALEATRTTVRSGVVGIVGVSRVERASIDSKSLSGRKPLSKRAFTDVEAIEILESVLQQQLGNFALGWIGTSRTRVHQPPLFALT